MKTLIIYGYGTFFDKDGNLVNPILTKKIVKNHLRNGNHVWIGVATRQGSQRYTIDHELKFDDSLFADGSISVLSMLGSGLSGEECATQMHRELVDTDYDMYQKVIYFDRFALELKHDYYLGRFIEAIHIPVFDNFLMQKNYIYLNFLLPSMPENELEQIINLVESDNMTRTAKNTPEYMNALNLLQNHANKQDPNQKHFPFFKNLNVIQRLKNTLSKNSHSDNAYPLNLKNMMP